MPERPPAGLAAHVYAETVLAVSLGSTYGELTGSPIAARARVLTGMSQENETEPLDVREGCDVALSRTVFQMVLNAADRPRGV